jgi:HSP20 family protein
MSKKHLIDPRSDVIGWPFLHSFQTEMNNLFDRFNGGSGRDMAVLPAIDVAETEDAVEVSADIPGVAKEDLEVTVANDTLVIKGEKSGEREDKNKDWHLVERSYGSFRRHVPLGFTPEDGKVDASFANGVLKLRIEKPKTASAENRRIEIK